MIDRLKAWRKQILRGISSQGLGGLGEDIARICFEHQGYTVMKPSESKTGDLWIVDNNGVVVRLEVKTARQGTERRWRYCLQKTSNRKNTDCNYADMVLLIQVTKINFYAFLVPADVIGTRRNISIRTSQPEYRGWLSEYAVKLDQMVLTS